MEKKIADILKRFYPDLVAIYLFGSRADGTARKDSDLDVAVLFPPELRIREALNFSDARYALEKALNLNVDLLNLNEINTVMQKEVIRYDRRIFSSDDYKAETFEMLTLSYYGKLNEERADILIEVKESGKVVG